MCVFVCARSCVYVHIYIYVNNIPSYIYIYIYIYELCTDGVARSLKRNKAKSTTIKDGARYIVKNLNEFRIGKNL